MKTEERKQWLSNLKQGDEVAFMWGGVRKYWVITKISKITPSGRFNLNTGTIINSDGSIRGDNFWYIQPVTDEIRRKVWRDKAVSKIKKELRIDDLSDNDLRVILAIMKND